MRVRNTSENYGSLAKFFHWFIFFTVLGLLIVGFLMEGVEPKPLRLQVYGIHKSVGLLVLALIILRLWWAVTNIKPISASGTRPWERWAEKFVHYGLYLLLIAMPLSGWIMSTAAGHAPNFFGLVTLPMPGIIKNDAVRDLFGEIHTFAAYTLITLLVIHVAAALKHHYINKDNVLKRMMPGKD